MEVEYGTGGKCEINDTHRSMKYLFGWRVIEIYTIGFERCANCDHLERLILGFSLTVFLSLRLFMCTTLTIGERVLILGLTWCTTSNKVVVFHKGRQVDSYSLG